MNSEIIAKRDNFNKLSLKKQLEFFQWVSDLKEEYSILKEENTILKEGLKQGRRVQDECLL